MKARVSALVDGELDDRGFTQAYDEVGRSGEALEAWRTYHLISDALRDMPVLSQGFAGRVAERLADEPTVIAPGRIAAEPRRWFALSAAASLAAVGLVGWMAFGPEQPNGLQAPIAKAPEAAPVKAAVVSPVNPALVPPPVSANDYLLAHQGFSPRVWLQGMAPYVRTVSEPAPGARK
jgi:sigma-E factor negative regulatory protein RseA